ncbi:MAG: PilT/PilU family type 4a pilus ATPase [Acidobacteria bacterium]|nr:PilT/PilU family type 4a pilus ATPase [Acidobacteriota bacterium]
MNRKKFDSLLQLAVEDGVSDIILAVGEAPMFRYSGTLIDIKSEALEARDTELIARLLLQHHFEDLSSFTACDVAYELEDIGRFRASVFKQRNLFRIVLRVIPVEIRTFNDLHLPSEITSLSELTRGLILITGATGQGKSTTISALLEQINRTRKAHIITVEDPVEFTYRKSRSLITQREIGEDVTDYQNALRQALRQSPDVIMIGEIRDGQTFDAVLTAAETGHLVISAIHTTDAQKTFGRILGFYGEQERQSLRERLANTLAAIISLRLLPSITGGERVPAVEILRMNPSIAECLRNPERLSEITSHMEKGNDYYGMRTFDQHIIELYKAGLIDLNTVRTAASRPTEVERALTLEGDS